MWRLETVTKQAQAEDNPWSEDNPTGYLTRLEELLDDGWEPISVTNVTARNTWETHIWLRKQFEGESE